MKKTKLKEISRTPLGIRVLAGGKASPSARMLYEVLYSNGTTKTEYGESIQGVFSFGLREDALRPDLFTHIHAAALLLRDLESACFLLDGYKP